MFSQTARFHSFLWLNNTHTHTQTYTHTHTHMWASQVVKDLPSNVRNMVSIPGKIPWRSKWQSTPVFLPGKSHGQRSLVGYSLWGLKRVGHILVTKQQQQHFIYICVCVYIYIYVHISLSLSLYIYIYIDR